MSALTISRSKKSGAGLEGTWPQVNLLPPEVTAARGLKHVKQWLGVALLLVLVVVGAGYAYGTMARSSADSELADAQAAAANLKTQMAQYAEITPIVSAIRSTSDARTYVMAPEVQWKPYLDAIAAVLPGNAEVLTFTVTQATVTLAPPAIPDALSTQGVAAIQFTAFVPGVPDSAAVMDALDSVPGFHQATVVSDTLGLVEEKAGYTLTGSVQVDQTALANRFPATSEGN